MGRNFYSKKNPALIFWPQPKLFSFLATAELPHNKHSQNNFYI
ncbi:hypothetical protein bcere0009_53740 [Bacillus cereus R309803]|nr:hypothetical protein bcere0009_53740 [Bacillus cereus R309803]